MAIDTIKSVNEMMNIQGYQQQHKVRNAAAIADVSAISPKQPVSHDPAKVNDPPFFPIGDTQSIYKK